MELSSCPACLPDEAQSYLNDALLVNPTDRRALSGLIRTSREKRDFNAAIGYCTKLLLDNNNTSTSSSSSSSDGAAAAAAVTLDFAHFTLAQTLFEAEKFEEAIKQTLKLLELFPKHAEGQALLVELYWRMARLEESDSLLDCCSHYAKGIYYRFSNDPNKALQAFNEARKDSPPLWRDKAIYQMIEIFLNPDNETIGGEVLLVHREENKGEEGYYYDGATSSNVESEMLSILMTERLLKVCAS